MANDTSHIDNLIWGEETFISMKLHMACSIGHEEVVREIVKELSVIDAINEKNIEGWTPLMYAVYSGNSEVVRFLLGNGALPSLAGIRGLTALMLASNCGQTHIAVQLIEAGACIDSRDTENWTALFHAAYAGHYDVLQLLLEKGCQVNLIDGKNGMTPLMMAAAEGHERIVKSLLQYGADVSVCSKDGSTARSLAVRNGHEKVKNEIDAYVFSLRNTANNVESCVQQSGVLSVLEGLGLSKYNQVFESHNIDLSVFWTLGDKDLMEIGIELLGPRRKILNAIAEWNRNSPTVPKFENQAISENLTMDYKKLQEELAQVKSLLSQEEQLRLASEAKLFESIEMLEKFKENVKKTALQMRVTENYLRTTLSSLMNLFSSVVQYNVFEKSSIFNFESKQSKIISFLSFMEKLNSDLAAHISRLL